MEELSGKPTQRTDGKNGRVCGAYVCVRKEGVVSGGVVRLDSAGEATPKVESGSQRMKITTANVSSIY